ncbi:MAG: hypothetical protein IPO66_22885 [Rhodanobacteraceae bacterium]|nr:hypothetical protein [Rhodanobacteraceae bacterium]
MRRFAWKSLTAIDAALAMSPRALRLAGALASFDFTGAQDERARSVKAIAAAFVAVDKRDWPQPPPATALDREYRLDEQVLGRLRELGARSDKQIDIGE